MAIRNRLESSIFIMTIFHWSWLSVAFYFLDVFHIKGKLQEFGFDSTSLNNFTLLSGQLEITKLWVAYALPWVILSIVTGFSLAWLVAVLFDKKRDNRIKGKGEYRGLTVTIGNLPKPFPLKINKVDIKLPLNDFPEEHNALLIDIISLIHSNPVPAGIGHGDLTLFDHTLNVINKAIEINKISPNALCAIAAHDMGKLSTFKHVDGEWIVEGKHDEVGASLMAKFDSWWNLSDEDRTVIYQAVKYSHKPEKVPSIISYREQICACIEDIRHVDHNVTGIEKEEVVEEIESDNSLLHYFKMFLQETPLRTSNTPNGQKAGGWIKHGHCFILESYFKDTYLAENHPHVLAAYNELGKKVRFSRITKELLKELNAEGMLAKKWNDEKISKTTEALWVIKCNKIQFIKVIIVPITEEIHASIGNDTYHKGLSVVSSFPKYLREQKKIHAGKKPAAKVETKSSTQEKIKTDMAKIKANKQGTNTNENKPKDDIKTKPNQSSKNEPTTGKNNIPSKNNPVKGTKPEKTQTKATNESTQQKNVTAKDSPETSKENTDVNKPMTKNGATASPEKSTKEEKSNTSVNKSSTVKSDTNKTKPKNQETATPKTKAQKIKENMARLKAKNATVKKEDNTNSTDESSSDKVCSEQTKHQESSNNENINKITTSSNHKNDSENPTIITDKSDDDILSYQDEMASTFIPPKKEVFLPILASTVKTYLEIMSEYIPHTESKPVAKTIIPGVIVKTKAEEETEFKDDNELNDLDIKALEDVNLPF